MGSDLIDIEVVLKHETELAWLVDDGDEKPVWIPKSQAEFDGETLTLPEWLALEKELI